ncbi:MAG: putative sulfate exporter family transporter, partial [Selenomonadaceae bacterium]|nr:putative sulfate exporter family transporter [Selenomonadaceae bacterium]
MQPIRQFFSRQVVAVGLVVTLACSLGGQWLSHLPGLSLIGALVIALLLGMALQGFTSLRTAARASTPFIANKFLRAGIILLGFKLNLILLMGAGLKSLLAACVVVTVMVTLNYVVARRLF